MVFRECLPDFNHGFARLHEAADMLADLSVGLSRLPEVVPHLLIGLVQSPPLLRTHPPHCAASGRGGQEQQPGLIRTEDTDVLREEKFQRTRYVSTLLTAFAT